MSYPRSGPASRAVALDLMLRTFMNSAEFHPSNPKIWDNISKLVPGTTPQQCLQRWEELHAASQSIVGDYTGLTAQGRPMSAHNQSQKRQMPKFVRSMASSPIQPSKSSQTESAAGYPESRPHSVLSLVSTDRSHSVIEGHRPVVGSHSGKFVANFCQAVLAGGGRREERAVKTGGDCDPTNVSTTESGSTKHGSDERTPTVDSSIQMSRNSTLVGEHGPNMVIHVCDEAKKLKRDFTCPRNVLVREMRYFEEYLSSDAQLWDEVDISVHCDVPVFEWLMRYAKRGMLEGPCGETLSEAPPAPKLEPANAVSILISSDFLKMENLVDECLDFCHANISAVVASPCNMGCINDKLIRRLVAKFTPLEVENIIDRKDKIKSKFFVCQLQQLFTPSYSTPECPANAATLYKCRHCGRLLTAEQQLLLPCTAQRLSVDHAGRVIYSHERDPGWDVSHHFHCMQQEGLSPRDIYWRLWGVVNWLVCEHCRLPFQCSDLPCCAYHPIPSTGGSRQHHCCQQPALSFSTLPQQQDGCVFKDHTVSTGRTTTPPFSSALNSPSKHLGTVSGSDSESEHLCVKDESTTNHIYSILLALREAVCGEKLRHTHSRSGERTISAQTASEMCLLLNEEKKPRQHSVGVTNLSHPPQHRERDTTDHTSHQPSNVASSSSNSSSRQPLVQGVAMTTRKQSHDLSDLEEDEDEEETQAPPQLLVQPPKPRKSRQRHRQPRGDNQYPPLPVDWIWDGRKSKRWNQDMQRESDERKMAALSVQLSKINSSSEHSFKTKEAGYAGRIFSWLEAQFRAQQAARALAQQSTQTRSQGSGRRKYSNTTQHC